MENRRQILTMTVYNGVTHQWDDICRLCDQLMGELFAKVDQVVDVDVAEELLQQRILLESVSVCACQNGSHALWQGTLAVPVGVGIAMSEVEDELPELILDRQPRVLLVPKVRGQHASRIHRLPVHICCSV